MAEGETRRQVARWIGEFGREAAVLIAVLGPMELLIKNGKIGLDEGAIVVSATLLFWGLGVYAGLDNDDD